MHLAAGPPGFGCRERLAGLQQQPKGKTNMSAKALPACSFELASAQTAATDHQAPEDLAVEILARGFRWWNAGAKS
jgi:hypothetical protein